MLCPSNELGHKYFLHVQAQSRGVDSCSKAPVQYTVQRKHDRNRTRFDFNHKSLIDMWNSWHQLYRLSPFPVSFLRYEDLLFHTETLTRQICRLEPTQKVQILHEESKSHHKKETNRETALQEYGRRENVCAGLTQLDLEWIQERMDPELMSFFGYERDIVKYCANE